MRKVYLFMMVTIDGHFEGPNHDISWHNVDAEFVDFAIKQLEATDHLIFGRRTYEMMASFWPSEEAKKADPETARLMTARPKTVFSRTLKSADWENTELKSSVTAKDLESLKNRAGSDIAVFGSSNLCVSLIELGLLDELRLMVNPVVLGKGTTLFAGLKKPLKLELSSSRNFSSGNVLLTYKVDK